MLDEIGITINRDGDVIADYVAADAWDYSVLGKGHVRTSLKRIRDIAQGLLDCGV